MAELASANDWKEVWDESRQCVCECLFDVSRARLSRIPLRFMILDGWELCEMLHFWGYGWSVVRRSKGAVRGGWKVCEMLDFGGARGQW